MFKKRWVQITVISLIIIIVGSVIFINNGISKDKDLKPKPVAALGKENIYALIPDVAAKVNSIDIKKTRVKIAINAALSNMHMRGEGIDNSEVKKILKDVVDGLISEELIYQQRDALKVEVTDKEVDDELQNLKKRFQSEEAFTNILKEQGIKVTEVPDEMRRNLTVRKVIKAHIEPDNIVIDDAAIKGFYDSNKDKFKLPDSVKISHILIKTATDASEEDKNKAKAKAEDILKKIKAGEEFEKLAKEFSEDLSAERGGDLGYISEGKTIPGFEKVAFSLKQGEISEVVPTVFGYHIIKAFDKKEGDTQSFEDSKNMIKEYLKGDKLNEQINNWIAELKKTAKVENFI